MSDAPECPSCGKPPPKDRCPGCGRPRADASERLYKYVVRCFTGDETAVGVVQDAFRVMAHPAGGGCANHLEAFLALCREAVATYGNLDAPPRAP